MIYYYSGCGNSRFVAKSLAEKAGEKLMFIPEEARLGHYVCEPEPGESVGFVFPVYCWAPPRLVLDFIARLEFKTKPAYCYAAITYGDSAGCTVNVLSKALAQRGVRLDSAYGFTMPETYINIKAMKLDTPEAARAKIEACKAALPGVSHRIAARECGADTVVRGSNARLYTYVVRPLFYAFLVKDKYWKAGPDCTGCGICAKVCPLQNIIIRDGRPKWQGHCTTCNACYHSCPHNAINFGRATLGKGQYLFDKTNCRYPPKTCYPLRRCRYSR